MKKIFLLMTAAALGFAACTEMESLAEEGTLPAQKEDGYTNYPPPPPPPRPMFDIETDIDKPQYKLLRNWKATPGLPQTFAWFDMWTATSKTGDGSMCGLPDSVTLIGMWSQPKWDLTPERRADMAYVQQVKGTKVIVTILNAFIGTDVPGAPGTTNADPDYVAAYNSTDPAVYEPAIKKYAKALYDEVVKAGYDGFDWDYEPAGGGSGEFGKMLWTHAGQRKKFVEELSYWFGAGAVNPDRDRGDRGPMPEKRLILAIDGEVGTGGRMAKDWLSYYFDYFILQAYNTTATSSLNTRVNAVVTDMSEHIAAQRITAKQVVARTIITENFESYAGTGGGLVVYMAPYVNATNAHQIGGVGVYRSSQDWDSITQSFRYIPQAITKLYNTYRSRQAQGLDPASELEWTDPASATL